MTKLQLETSFLLYYNEVYGFCLKCLSHKQDAEDLTMTIFLNLCIKRDTIVFDTVENYLLTSARNKVIDFHKRQMHARKYVNKYGRESESITIYDDSKYIFNFIEKLPPKMKESFKLMHIYGYNRNQISKIMGTSPLTVRNNIAAATSKINSFVKNQ